MKRILYYSLFACTLLVVSCDKKLDDLNRNQTSATAIDPVFQLNSAVFSSSFPSTTVMYEVGIVQQMISPNSGVLTGANYNQDNRLNTQVNWQAYYRNVIRNTRDIIARTKDVPERSNLMNMARLIQAHAFMVLTDTYGDIPYTEGGAGFTNQVFLPKYDAQAEIYANLLQEFTQASAALNPAGRVETGDILYGGNITQWKRFGYSLLLRAGMRLSKVDPARAQTTVQAAFQGGVMLTNADNALVRHTPDYQNPIGNMLNSTEAANFYLAKPFVDHLKNTGDPRLSSIAIRYVGAKSGPEQTPAVGNTTAALQIGMPMGKDNGTAAIAATADGLASYYEYSQVDRRRMVKTNAPMFIVTAAQTNLLLAEAALRGWITTGTPQAYYEAGIRAHMEQMASYDAGSAIAAPAIQQYINDNPFVSGTGLQQINTQYWIASFLNGPEAWANFRRSSFPSLAPNPFPGKDITGNFINRLTYPNSEISVNTPNVNAAIAKQGADNLDTKVWWDK